MVDVGRWDSQVAQWWRICLQCRKCRKCVFDSWVRKTPWRKKWQPTPVFLPKKSQGQRSLAGYSAWGHKESGTTEWLSIAQWATMENWFSSIIMAKIQNIHTFPQGTGLGDVCTIWYIGGFPGGSVVKNPPNNARGMASPDPGRSHMPQINKPCATTTEPVL